MKKSIYLISILVLMMSSACNINKDAENHDPNPLVAPTSIDASSGEDTISFHLICSENPDGAYLYDEDGDNVTVVIDPETPLPDCMSFNEDTGVIIVRRTSDLSGTLRFWTVDDMGGSTEDQPLTVTYNITQWTAAPGESAVYVAGYYTDVKEVASYWKDGEKVNLFKDSENNARAQSIYVVDSDVYVAGFYEDGSNVVACYWNNGVKFDLLLPVDANDSKAYDIMVESGIVYIAGYYEDSSFNDVACTWKDSTGTITRVDLQPTATSVSRAKSLFVSGSSIYVAGHYLDSNDSNKLKDVPCYWINGTLYDLPKDDIDIYGYGESIYFDGTNVYVGGSRGFISCYWKNSVKTDIESSSNAYGIAFSGTNLYIAGYYLDGILKTVYWKESSGITKVELPQESSTAGYAYGICVSGTDVYISGYNTISGVQSACYWKDGSILERTILYSTSKSEALDIFVVP